MRLLLTLSAMALLNACAPAVSSRPCPRVTEFPRETQLESLAEIKAAGDAGVQMPATWRMLNAMAADRAANRAICPRPR